MKYMSVSSPGQTESICCRPDLLRPPQSPRVSQPARTTQQRVELLLPRVIARRPHQSSISPPAYLPAASTTTFLTMVVNQYCNTERHQGQLHKGHSPLLETTVPTVNFRSFDLEVLSASTFY